MFLQQGLVLCFVLTFQMAFAASGPDGIPSDNYDDYDQPKYEKLYQSAYQQYLLDQRVYNDRVNDLNAAKDIRDRESRELNDIQGQMENTSREKDNVARSMEISYQEQVQLNEELRRQGIEIERFRKQIEVSQREYEINARNVENMKKTLDSAAAQTERLNKMEQAAKVVYDEALSQSKDNKKKAKDLENQISVLMDQVKEAKSVLADLEKQLGQSKDDAQKEIIQKEIDNKKNYISETQKVVQSKNADLKALNDAQVELSKKENETKQSYDNAHLAAQTQRDHQARMQKDYDGALALLENQGRKITEMKRHLNEATNQYARSRERYDRLQNEYERMADRFARLKDRLENLNENRRRQIEVVNREESNVRNREYEVNNAERVMQASKAVANNQQVRLAEVQDNIEQSRQIMKRVAEEDGGADGTKEGTENGEVHGKKIGTEQGVAAGLQAAYNLGHAEGLEDGSANGSDPVAYQKGYKNGEVIGYNQADAEAQAQEPVGFANKENEFRSQELKQTTVGSLNQLSSHFKGLQGGRFDIGDGRYYNPRPKNYPHSVITNFYTQYYDQFYRSYLSSSFASAKEAARKVYYQMAFDQYKNDPQQKKKGFIDGRALGSENKGYADGQISAYQKNITPLKNKYYADGQNRATIKYTQGAVLEFVSSELVDADGDGVLRPGEKVYSKILVKNYGYQAQTSLLADLKMTSGVGLDYLGSNTVPALPGQSLITIVGSGVALARPDATSGSQFAAQLNVKDVQGVAQFSNRHAGVIQYPTVTRVGDFDGVLVPGEVKKITLGFSNISNKTQILDVQINFDIAKVNIQPAGFKSISVSAGGMQTVELTVEGKLEAEFEATQVVAAITQSGLKFSEDVVLRPTIIRRHRATEGSLGLIISGDFSKGGGSSLYKNLKMDTWDLRVDGRISAGQLDSYSSKVIHLMIEPTLRLDADTVSSLKNFVQQQKGAIIAWGSSLQTLPADMISLLGVTSNGSAYVNTAAEGAGILQGMKLSMNQSLATLSAVNAKAVPVLLADKEVLGMSMLHGEFADKLSRIFVFSFSPQSITKEQMGLIVERMELFRKSFSEKMKLAKSNESYLGTVMSELYEEINNDAIRTDIRWLKDNLGHSKLALAIDNFLDKGTPTRSAFARIYPQMNAYIKKIQVPDTAWAASDAIETRRVGKWYNSITWKQLYCSEGRGSAEWRDICSEY